MMRRFTPTAEDERWFPRRRPHSSGPETAERCEERERKVKAGVSRAQRNAPPVTLAGSVRPDSE